MSTDNERVAGDRNPSPDAEAEWLKALEGVDNGYAVSAATRYVAYAARIYIAELEDALEQWEATI
jgi:hypothetical protein